MNNDDWWEKEFDQRPDGNRNKVIVGNCIKLLDPVDSGRTKFKINTAQSLIECIRVMAKRFKRKERTYVLFVSEEQLDLLESDS